LPVVEGWRLHTWGRPPIWEPIDVPEPGPAEVLVEVEACGVGRTVLNCMNGNLDDAPELLPLVPGHEVVGRVRVAGEGVARPRPGDRIVAYFYLSCFRCPSCLAGAEARCENLAGWYGVHRGGGYAPLTLLPSGNAIQVPDDLPAAVATVIPDAVATPVHVCRSRLGLRPGDRVAVVGAGGGVGVHMIQVARACGAQVAGLDLSEDKLALIHELGASAVASRDLAQVRLDELGGEADAVIDLVGTPQTLSWGVDVLRPGGRLCVLTTFRDVTFEVAPRELVFKEIAIVGSRYASRAELSEAAELVATGEVRPVVSEVVGARDVGEIHEHLSAGRLRGRGAIVWGAGEAVVG
jgi:D-arabinose 1-dehydrogenase-like Zn-dependent alcohol dehydrogenase